jgi:DNA-binding winged helix-turn-helix (wHTH) protein
MVFRFPPFELDDEQRELRLNGREVALQPRVLDLLLYLVRHRERVVTKDELLEAIWSDVIVADGALQRAVSLARSALEQGGAREAVRTYSRHGYRFCAEVTCEENPGAGDESPVLLEARRAYERCEWDAAVSGFREADREGLVASDLERWAHAEQCAGREPSAVGPLERAVAAHSAMGDRRGAARAALLLAQIRAEQREDVIARAWHRRAESLLAGEGECRERGLLEWLASRFAAAEGDLEGAVRHAERTLDLGRRLPDPDLEALGLLLRGLALLAMGDVREGTALQDEAGAAALSGDVTPWVGGTVYCGIIWGCRNVADWQRAAQWTEQFSRWVEQSGLSGFPGLCRLHRAEVLCVSGELETAEQEAREALALLARSAPWAEGDAFRVLGEIRLSRGDLQSAEEAFRRAYELGWDPQPGYALLHMARGRHDSAVRALERGLEDRRWVNGQRRGLLLAHLGIAAATAGDCGKARDALGELDRQPELSAAPAIAALVARARAEIALCEERSAEAVASLREGLRLWQDVGAPVNVAVLRLRLAEALIRAGDEDTADLELRCAESIYRKLGAAAALESCQQVRRTLDLADC